jgi:membrane-associated phospholipid phosphatase
MNVREIAKPSFCRTLRTPFRRPRPARVAGLLFLVLTLSAAPSRAAPAAAIWDAAATNAGPQPTSAASADATASPTPSTPVSAQTPAGGPDRSGYADYAFEPSIRCPFCGITPEHPTGRFGLHWHDHWRHVGLPEYILTPTLFAVAGVFGLGVLPQKDSPSWTGPILFDAWARIHLALKSSSGRKTAGALSDAFLFTTIGQTTVLDNLVVAWAVRQNPEVAWQMLVINSQAYALTLALNSATKYLTGRERPAAERCTPGSTGAYCSGSSRIQSFYSGHAAVTATGAGLVCAHHTQLNLYTSPIADTAACATSVALSLATATARISAEDHWASDVIVGELAGFASGYVLPTLIYYSKFRVAPTPSPSAPAIRVAVLPVLGPDSLEVMAIGML